MSFDKPLEPLRILPIVEYPNPLLKEVCQPVIEISPEFIRFAKDMLYTLASSKDGIGLAAPQVGLAVRLIVMSVPGKKPQALFNPKIVNSSKGSILRQEGCLSLPGKIVNVSRRKWVSVVFTDISSNKVRRKYYDLEAACVSHEIDHLNGITI